ncbi:hypothetical protein DBA29_20280 [Xenophilus aerolatus]|nr:hypothetical protein [Xenophilus aerolatus]
MTTATEIKSFVSGGGLRRVDDLVPFDRNSRTHSEAQVAQIAASIKEFGFTNPILVDEANTIIAGEGRWRAAKKLKMDEVPCIVIAGLSPAQKAAYVIADNKLGLNSAWDTEMLMKELARLDELHFDVDLAGFSEVEILNLSCEVVVDAPAPDVSNGVGEQVENGTQADGFPTPPEKDWSGMPEFVQPDARPFRSVIVHMLDQAAADQFAALIGQTITEKTKYVFFPKKEQPAGPKEVFA